MPCKRPPGVPGRRTLPPCAAKSEPRRVAVLARRSTRGVHNSLLLSRRKEDTSAGGVSSSRSLLALTHWRPDDSVGAPRVVKGIHAHAVCAVARHRQRVVPGVLPWADVVE